MFDCIIPIGETCNITFLLQNAKIKKQTTLFEWFVSPNLNNITNILIKIVNNINDDIIKKEGNHVFIGDKIFSGHYNYEEFKIIYKRRCDRLLNIIRSSKNILFCRFEGNAIFYNKEDIDNFINSILSINKNIDNIKILLITPGIELEHPSLIKVIYNKHHSDPYCKSKEINNLFINTLEEIGYDLNYTTNTVFTDRPDI